MEGLPYYKSKKITKTLGTNIRKQGAIYLANENNNQDVLVLY